MTPSLGGVSTSYEFEGSQETGLGQLGSVMGFSSVSRSLGTVLWGQRFYFSTQGFAGLLPENKAKCAIYERTSVYFPRGAERVCVSRASSELIEPKNPVRCSSTSCLSPFPGMTVPALHVPLPVSAAFFLTATRAPAFCGLSEHRHLQIAQTEHVIHCDPSQFPRSILAIRPESLPIPLKESVHELPPSHHLPVREVSHTTHQCLPFVQGTVPTLPHQRCPKFQSFLRAEMGLRPSVRPVAKTISGEGEKGILLK
jgi:hypothetical protein